VKDENVSGVEMVINPNGSLKVHPKYGKATIVEVFFPKNFSKCVEADTAEKMALNILLNDSGAKKTLLKLIEVYGDLVVAFYKRQGFESDNKHKVCTGELEIYPKGFFLRDFIIKTNVDLVNKKLYLVPVLCDEVVGNFCIRSINFEFRKPTDKEREFVKGILKGK